MKQKTGQMGISRFRTAIMGFAAVWIWFFHCNSGMIFDNPGWPREIEFFLKRIGFTGVDLFFLLSGFGLYYAFRSHPVKTFADYGKYLGKRLVRVYEVFLPVTVFLALAEHWNLQTFFLRLTTISAWTKDFYDYLWFVPGILLCYLWAPLYDRLFEKVKSKTLLMVVTGLIWIFLLYLLQGHFRPDLSAILNRIPVFTLGFWFGYMEKEEKWKIQMTIICALLTLLVAFPLSYLINMGRIPLVFEAENALVNVLIAPGMVLIWSSILEGLSSFKIGNVLDKLLCIWGVMSLEFYCLQMYVNNLVRIYIGNDSVKKDILSLLVCTVTAYAAHMIIQGISNNIKKLSARKKA